MLTVECRYSSGVSMIELPFSIFLRVAWTSTGTGGCCTA